LSDAIDNAQQVMRKSNIGPSVMDGLKSKLNAIPLDGDKDMIHNAMRKLQMGCTETNELSKDVAKSLAQLPGDCLGLAPSEVYNAESVADIFEKHHNVIDEMSVTAHCTIGDVMGDSLPSDWMHLIRLLAKDKMISGYYASDEHTMGMNTHNVFIRMNDWWYVLLAFHKDIQRGTGVVTGMKIYEEHRPGYILNLIAEYERTGKLPKTPIRRINIKIDKTLLDPQYALAACTEGIRVSKDGDLDIDSTNRSLREFTSSLIFSNEIKDITWTMFLIYLHSGNYPSTPLDILMECQEYIPPVIHTDKYVMRIHTHSMLVGRIIPANHLIFSKQSNEMHPIARETVTHYITYGTVSSNRHFIDNIMVLFKDISHTLRIIYFRGC
jgi:hypothetical protein